MPFLSRLLQQACQRVVSTILQYSSVLIQRAATYLPTHMYEIVHLNTETMSIHSAYQADETCYRWFRAFPELDLPDTGAYAVTMWDNQQSKYTYHVLTAENLRQALGVSRMSTAVGLTDVAWAHFLRAYIQDRRRKDRPIFGLTLGGQDVYKPLREYLGSMEVPDNITPEILYLLWNHTEGNEPDPKKHEDIPCVLTDFNLDEHDIARNECILTPVR